MAVDDLSLEPLFNQSAEGDGISRKVAFVPVNLVGVTSHRTPVTVSVTAQEITIGTGKRTMEIQNTGSKVIYYGGSGVTSTAGIKLFPNQTKTFANVQDTFSVYLVCASGETSTARLVEYT